MSYSQGVRNHGNTWESLSNELAPSTTAYADGDVIGGMLTFPDVVESDIGGGLIVDAMVYDTSTNIAPLELVLLSRTPSTGTVTSATGDNAAFDLADTDLTKVCAQIIFSSDNQSLYADNQIHYSIDPIRSFYLPSDKDMYGFLINRGTPTYSCGNIMSVKLVVTRDA